MSTSVQRAERDEVNGAEEQPSLAPLARRGGCLMIFGASPCSGLDAVEALRHRRRDRTALRESNSTDASTRSCTDLAAGPRLRRAAQLAAADALSCFMKRSAGRFDRLLDLLAALSNPCYFPVPSSPSEDQSHTARRCECQPPPRTCRTSRSASRSLGTASSPLVAKK